MNAGEVVRLDQNLDVVQRVRVGSEPRSIAVDEPARTLYVALYGEDAVLAFDLDTLEQMWRKSVPRGPRFIVLHGTTGNVIVGSALTGEVSVLSREGSLITKRVVGLAPTSAAINGTSGTLFVTDYASGNLLELDPVTLEILASGQAGYGATGIGFNQAEGQAFVGNAFGDIVARLPLEALSEGTELPSSISVQGFVFPAGLAHGFAADYRRGLVYRCDPTAVVFSGPLSP
jgi:DNA-binding beta-propeller fold protein YncE